MRKSIRRICSI